jgi:hypothetical protein
MASRSKKERFWADETDPDELERRARDLDRDGMMAAAKQLRDQARALRGYDD